MRVSGKVVTTLAKNIFKLKVLNNRNLDTIIPHFYITNKCNIYCSYCDDGTGVKYPDQKIQPLDTEKTKKLLQIMRKKCTWISITGGEPLVRPDLVELLKYMREELKFEYITLNTNAFLLDKKEEALKYVDQLIISLDTTDMEEFAKIIDRPVVIANKIKENIITYAAKQKEGGYRMTVNSVILPGKINEARKVMHLCFENKIIYSPMPCIIEKRPDPKLVGNKEYQDFIKEIIQHKKDGKHVFGTFESLKGIINFDRFECLPTLIMDVYSDGTMYYPCSPLQKVAGNLLEIGDWDKTVQAGIEKHGKIGRCAYSCHVSCYMEPSLIAAHPLSMIGEMKTFDKF